MPSSILPDNLVLDDLGIVLNALDKKHFAAGLAGLTAVVLAVCLLLIPGQNNFLQRWLYDQAQRHAAMAMAEHVVIVAIDDDSKAKLGEWPWSNSVHAKLVEQLRSAGARAIAFTTSLSETHRLEHDSSGAVDGDQQFIQAMQHHGRVLLPLEVSTHLAGDSLVPALEPILQRNRMQADAESVTLVPTAQLISSVGALLTGAYAVGHLLEPTDADGVTRRELLAVRLGDRVLPALSVVLASTSAAANDPRFSSDQLQLGEQLKATALQQDLSFSPRLHPQSGAFAIPQFSYWRAVNGTLLASNFKGKLVLVGFTDGSNADRVQTALGYLPRIAVIAAATESLLSGTSYSHPLWTVVLQAIFAIAIILLVTAATLRLARNAHLLLAGAVVVLVLASDFALMRSFNVSVQLVPLCLALLLSALLAEAWRTLSTDRSTDNSPGISMDTLKTLALTLHGQGQLDLAYETLRRCAVNTDTLDLLYRLAADYERRQEMHKATQVFAYILKHNPTYKDVQQRFRQLARSGMPLEKPAAKVNPTVAKPANSSAASSSTKQAPPKAARKEILGRYELDRQIGKGAMGVVYLGRDPKINRVVAIKAIPLAEEFEDQDLVEARERFFREAEMAGRLNHPGIVTIYDAGEDHGLAYIAMEFIHGEHLSYYTDPKRLLPIRKALSLVLRMAEALHYAHLQNVVHRDIKPANIMFNIETDTLKITDFGIARLADVSRTKTGIVLGTPSFMSPEQLEGRPLDGRSDLFAVGVTMYQLLTGLLPFRADSMTRLMNNIATEPHPPLRSIRPELPVCLEEIVDRALAKAAEDRYQTGAEMAEAIRSCMRTIAP
jgi:CHASE2 domain-containing sensor protein